MWQTCAFYADSSQLICLQEGRKRREREEEGEREKKGERGRNRGREGGRVLMETPDGAPATTQESIKWVWRADEQMSLQQAEDKHGPAGSGSRMVPGAHYGFQLSS